MTTGQMPNKFADLNEIEPEGQDRTEKGQILIIFAIFLFGLIGILGLATDVGYAMAAKRSAQGAADAGAINGARMIARYTDSAPTSAGPEIQAAMSENKFGTITPSTLECNYIGSNWAIVGNCNQTVPSNAVGARVQTRVVFNTFFMQIFPGAPDTIEATGYAKARVEFAVTVAKNAPLMICGTSAWDVSGNAGTTDPLSASHANIVNGSGRIEQSSIGKTFRVVDPALFQAGNANCDARSDQFSGIADTGSNGGKGVGNRFTYRTSSTIPSTTTEVDGPSGCEAGTSAPFECVMVLPIASPGESTSNNDLRIVAFAAFKITSVDGIRFNATLLDDYIVTGKGQNTWNRGAGGVVVVRLIW